MSLIEFVLKLNGRFLFLRNISQNLVKWFVLRTYSRNYLNKIYNKISFHEKSIFHALYGRIFRDGKTYSINGEWILKFAGHEIKIPLESESLWLDWETALSVLGHDYEIKKFYETQITSSTTPKCFLDIGANYGTHSLLFLSAGIKAISIEPNPECNPYFQKLANYNKVQGEWYGIALGMNEGKAIIQFPEGETWLGSISKTDFFNRKEVIKSYPIDVKTLDGFLKENELKPDLIKIDTEGYEEGVIKGGEQFLIKNSPSVIFEANSHSELEVLTKIFRDFKYRVFSLKTMNEVNEIDVFNLKKENNILARGKSINE